MEVKLCILTFILLWGTIAANTNIPAYKIDLDLPEEQRWDSILADFKGMREALQNVIIQMVPKSLIPLVDRLGADIDQYFPKPFAGELRGVAKAYNFSLGEMVLLNIIYDISAHCTSIISQDAAGYIWHSRNLDYRFTEALRNVTIYVEFTRHGKVVYSGTTFAGYVGLVTGQRPHAFTISVDERSSDSFVIENILTALLDKSASMISFTVRQTLEEEPAFTQAVMRLAARDTIAPVYYIVGGVYPGQGAIITRDRLSPRDTWFLDPAQGRWFIVETNYDHWKPPPKSDDRRDAAIKMMNAMGQKHVDSAHLFKVMITQPVGRPNMTVYTSIMCAGQPEVFSTWVWPLNTTTTEHNLHFRSSRNHFRSSKGHSRSSGNHFRSSKNHFRSEKRPSRPSQHHFRSSQSSLSSVGGASQSHNKL